MEKLKSHLKNGIRNTPAEHREFEEHGRMPSVVYKCISP